MNDTTIGPAAAGGDRSGAGGVAPSGNRWEPADGPAPVLPPETPHGSGDAVAGRRTSLRGRLARRQRLARRGRRGRGGLRAGRLLGRPRDRPRG